MSELTGEKIQRLEPLQAGAVQIAQVTDCHIFASAGAKLRGMDTRQSFEAIKQAILATDEQYDLLLATGDLAQDGSDGAYRYLAEQLSEFDAPTFWLPGNHDDIDALERSLVGPRIQSDKLLLAGNWLIVLLDSTIAGEVHGRVSNEQLDFMDNALHQHQEKHALVCLHHQAQETGSEWIDDKGLKDAEQLRARLARHDNLRGVLWGHVHQEAHQNIDGVQWMSTPSSCVQFKPGSKDFALSDENPGYRFLRLKDDGSIETSVRRVKI